MRRGARLVTAVAVAVALSGAFGAAAATARERPGARQASCARVARQLPKLEAKQAKLTAKLAHKPSARRQAQLSQIEALFARCA